MTSAPARPDRIDRVLILDFGSQYTQLIARRVREQHVYCEIHPYSVDASVIRGFGAKGIILSGGPASVDAPDAPHPDGSVFELGIPVLGVCYGLQVMTVIHGGEVAPSATHEFGRATLRVDPHTGDATDLFARVHAGDHAGDDDGLTVWMSHSDQITQLGDGFAVTARTTDGVIAAVAHKSRPLYGVQFHPEVAHTPLGADLLAGFIFDICGCVATWTPDRFIEMAIERIREQVGETDQVVCGLSGGVDSSVAALLIHRAIGERLHCIYVDNGLMRKNETEGVIAMFEGHFTMPLITVDAGDAFLSDLAGIEDPEAKRKRIGHRFIEVFDAEASKLPNVRFLAQGTLYPDVIESVSFKGPSATIKSHHNVGGLPDHMDLSLVEPLRELFKDEVREVGMAMGLPEEMVWRQPFPGPGMAVRILGEVTAERVAILQEADAIVREELSALPEHREIWQSFAVLLPVRSVGVMGDNRTYENVCAVRAVSSVDGMTADWYPVPYACLGRISNRIINEVRGINRVTYDISSKPPATIEWE